ncbi:hypothetical protein UCRPC4_g00414 [Phaeomoniella chlamydospora]|uniref:Uncharacterized protein n=1 Tax=Phaeomoniella chlamydospora TaxID=158046 RepID=A0A0G2F2S9_PHACM|nr:hypothetical protein UCRPC4_g00414 [Phaeomoniella chlamydospora]
MERISRVPMTTYDPNWREFIDSTLVQIVEGFEDLIGPDLAKDIENVLAIGAIGEMRRNGTYPQGDNLALAYTNPGFMRTLIVGWIGERLENQTLIDFANGQGTMLLELFRVNGSNTAGEYNAPTYYGMDMWALGATLKYGAEVVTEAINRGEQFVPAFVHWASDPDHTPYPYVGFFSLYPSASTITAVADENRLVISYPNSTEEGTDIVTFALSNIAPKWLLAGNTITGLESLRCLEVKRVGTWAGDSTCYLWRRARRCRVLQHQLSRSKEFCGYSTGQPFLPIYRLRPKLAVSTALTTLGNASFSDRQRW